MTQRLIMMKGLPGSGKSTWAKEQVDRSGGAIKRINRDDMRAMIDNGKWSKKNEKFIVDYQHFFITTALMQDYSVIVDDTNLNPKNEVTLRALVDQHNSMDHLCLDKKPKVEFVIKDFTDVPLEECIKRDQNRSNYVGEKVIKGMYNQYLKPVPEPAKKAEWIEGLPTAILCDLDGTLALFDGNPYDRDFLKDRVNKPVKDIIDMYYDSSAKIILVSGRNSKFRRETVQWLKTNNIFYKDLFMPRAPEDSRKDFIVKEELYDAEIKGKYNVLFVLDDRDQVVKLWRDLGLVCLQVAPGNF